MRRKKQQLLEEDAILLLEKCETAVLAVNTEKGYPYAVPINYVYHDRKVYFHSGSKGLKMNSIRENEKVSLCIVAEDTVIPERFATDYQSVILFGKARIVTEESDKLTAIRLLNHKYSSEYEEKGENEIKKSWKAVVMVGIDIEEVTGKQSKNRII